MDQTLTDSSHLCPKCHTLHFRNVNEVAPGREVYPQGDEAEEPFRSDWAEFHDIGLPYLLPIHNSFDELEQSAQRGCHFCLQILYSFSPDDVTEFHSSKNAGTTSRKVWLEYREGEKDVGRSTRKVLYVSYHRTIRVLELLPRGVPLRAASHPGHDGSGNAILRQIDMRTSPKPNEHTGSKANLELALQWMEKCLQEHKAVCGAVSNFPPTLPKRVINVASDPPSLYIGSGKRCPYAILSHCWGRNKLKPIRTTSDNLSDRCKAIPWDIMPKTYQDAVTATRGLNIKYLWIDSLCILQKRKSGGPSDPDSTKDWLEESLKMEDYYGNATITIEASYATDDTIGCFAKRGPRALLPCDIRIKFPDQFKIVEFTSWLSEGSRAADHWSLPHRRRGQRMLRSIAGPGVFKNPPCPRES